MYSPKKGYCEGTIQGPKTEEEVKVKINPPREQAPGLVKPTKPITNITDEIVNTYIKENLGTLTNYVRNERVMKTQRKQMNARPLLNNVF